MRVHVSQIFLQHLHMMKLTQLITTLASPFVLLAPGTASAITLMFNSTADTTLNERFADNNVGGQTTLQVGFTGNSGGNSERRGLLQFDLSAIPATAVITSASLELSVPNGNTGGTPTFSLHRLNTAWNEGVQIGNNGRAALAGEATWNTSGVAPWASPGAGSGTDFVAAASASAVIGGVGSYTWDSAGTAADVQAWVNGSTTNNGWILLQSSTGVGTARRFSANGAPVLTVEFTNVPEPSLSTLLGISAITLLFRRRRA